MQPKGVSECGTTTLSTYEIPPEVVSAGRREEYVFSLISYKPLTPYACNLSELQHVELLSASPLKNNPQDLCVQAAVRMPREPENVDSSSSKPKAPSATTGATATSRPAPASPRPSAVPQSTAGARPPPSIAAGPGGGTLAYPFLL